MQVAIDGRRCEGKVALITGASRGIGAAIARRLGTEGASVACAARTLDPDPRYAGTLTETVAAIRESGGTAEAFQVDLSDAADRAKLVDDVSGALGPVDILVNNAAVTFFLPFDTFPEKRFRLMVEVQLWASIDLAQRVIPGMRAAGAGSIINISSRGGEKAPGPPWDDFYSHGNSSVYGMIKSGLDRLSISMAAELHGDGIVVNSLAPWANVATPGASGHDLTDGYQLEPVEYMAQAALELSTGEHALAGRVAFSQPLLSELGVVPRSLDGSPFVAGGG
jgi:NAD(P)-dependent dehydrogenase (short-subunit alcohol dehydrogenase family)